MDKALVILIIQAAVKYGPQFAEGLVEIFHKETPTRADWQAVFALARTPYETYLTGSTPPTPLSGTAAPLPAPVTYHSTTTPA